jgi:alkylation response protein AidB-like acyl-CoA dehydrogenase
METLTSNPILKGGEFLLKEVPTSSRVFIPEEFSDEERTMMDSVREFIRTRVLPNDAQIEKQDMGLLKQLLEEAGQLGLLGTAIPEEYGGSAQSFLFNVWLTETKSEARSFALTLGAHTGIGTLPILYFGNEQQRAKYLPALVSGELKAAYCLTEPGSGSDALAAKSNASLSPDKTHYILNGQKMWITNGGIADVFIVFAQADGNKFTSFIVERNWNGVSVGAEEAKLGIKGSSTRQIFFENVHVPLENVLGQVGKGHRIAFNILNIGRIKLASGAVGASKLIASLAIQYANERHQFGKPIASFGAIQHKIAEMAIRIFAAESGTYRAANRINVKEEQLLEEGTSYYDALLGAAEEYAIECALLKVAGSEALDYVADEGVQIYGGMGYSEEAPMARAYRDARINRIFEGTNEINRMLAVDMLLKRAMKGQLDLMNAVLDVQKEAMSPPSFAKIENDPSNPLAHERHAVRQMKKAFLVTIGATVNELMMKLQDEQEILINLSDIMQDIYLAESVILRTEKLIQLFGAEKVNTQLTITRVFVNEAIERTESNARKAISSWASGDTLNMLLMAVKRFTKHEFINAKDMRRTIAASFIAANKYHL